MGNFYDVLTVGLIQLTKRKRTFVFYFFVTLIFLIILYIIQDTFHFLHNSNLEQKLNRINQIQNILSSQVVTPELKTRLLELENQIMQDSSFLESLEQFIGNSYQTIPNKIVNRANANIPYSIFWHTLSSGWIGYFISAVSIYDLIAGRFKEFQFYIKLFTLGILNITLFSLITYYFPKSDSNIFNYVVNLSFYSTVQLVLGFLLLENFIDHEKIEEKYPIF
jgi:hypothetical protein